jgi:hypothetical protein
MPSDRERFTNVILCEDIRHEVGNKRTLVGVFGGDVIVPHFPANLRLAVYMQYAVDPAVPEATIDFTLWHDAETVAKLAIQTKPISPTMTLEMSQALMTVEKETHFRITASIAGREAVEILNKEIRKGKIETR